MDRIVFLQAFPEKAGRGAIARLRGLKEMRERRGQMEINGKTRTCGLIGDPVEHTLSPVIHNTLAARLGQELVYVPFHVKQGKLAEAVKGAEALNILGLNVTVPYKSGVIACLAEIDELAKNIGAVNTLVRTAGGYKGYNTDMEGLYRAMQSEGVRIAGEEIILLGAGGAVRAVAWLCAMKGARRVYLLNRTLDKAQTVAAEVNASAGRETVLPMRLEDYAQIPEGKYLAIQGTSVGLSPNNEDVVIADDAFYEKVHMGFDLIYSPWETKFMRLVKAHGGKACNGLKMLLYQGIIAYELWNGVEVPEEEAQIVYGKLKDAVS